MTQRKNISFDDEPNNTQRKVSEPIPIPTSSTKKMYSVLHISPLVEEDPKLTFLVGSPPSRKQDSELMAKCKRADLANKMYRIIRENQKKERRDEGIYADVSPSIRASK